MNKYEKIKALFSDCSSPELIYQRIIECGKKLPSFDPQWKREENLVPGCQSRMYLHTIFEESKIYFLASSDALISSGLAAILIEAYSGESPETILTCPPTFLEEINIPSSLTPGRVNGLANLYLKMKQEALKLAVLLSKEG